MGLTVIINMCRPVTAKTDAGVVIRRGPARRVGIRLAYYITHMFSGILESLIV
jgi:hypothetical protein